MALQCLFFFLVFSLVVLFLFFKYQKQKWKIFFLDMFRETDLHISLNQYFNIVALVCHLFKEEFSKTPKLFHHNGAAVLCWNLPLCILWTA